MTIRDKRLYLWHAVDQNGDVVDVLLQTRRDASTARWFFSRLMRRHGQFPWKIANNKLASYGVAHRTLVPDLLHITDRYAHNRAEHSHEITRFRERGMRRFKSADQVQRFLEVHSASYKLFNLGRHLVRASHYRDLEQRAFASWSRTTAG